MKTVMYWQKSIRGENEPDIFETVFVCRQDGTYDTANYLGYGVYSIRQHAIGTEDLNPVIEWMIILKPKRLS